MVNNNLSSYFPTGKFAKLCGTTKDTLFHYDEIGLLSPVIVKDNGYRYYTVNQLYIFDLIKTLKNSGCSLIEIKEYLSEYDTDHFVEFIQKRRQEILKQQQMLNRTLTILDNTVNVTKAALASKIDEPELVEMPEEYLIVSPCNSGRHLTYQETGEMLHNHFSYCEDVINIEKLPLGYIVLKETLFSSELNRAFLYTRVSTPINNERMLIKPAGTYAVLNHKGGYDTIGFSYQMLFDFIEKKNYHICGNSYELELVTYLATKSEDDYVLNISIQIEK